MAVDAKALGLQVLAELYPDPTVREARMTELGDAGLTALGNGVLRREDHSRLMNETAAEKAAAAAAKTQYDTLYGQNKDWWETHQADLEELDRLKAGLKPGEVKPGEVKEPKYLTAEEYAKQQAEVERGAVGFIAETNALMLQHFQQFGEVLDINALLADRRIQQLGLRGVYADKHKAQLDAKIAEKSAAAEQKIRDDERAKVLAERGSQHHPYPVRGNEPSTLDGLQAPADQRPKVATVDDMAAEYVRLGAARTGAAV